LQDYNFGKKTDRNIRIEYWQTEKELRRKKDRKRRKKTIYCTLGFKRGLFGAQW
jgi:hypothetical protein